MLAGDDNESSASARIGARLADLPGDRAMRVTLTATVCALMLSGCAIDWPTKTSGPHFSWNNSTSSQAALHPPERLKTAK
jgi:hypothetical protein